MTAFAKLLLALSCLVTLAACGSSPPVLQATATPYIQPPATEGNCVLLAGQEESLPVKGFFPADATYQWYADAGTFKAGTDTAPVASYTPASVAEDTKVNIWVEVTSNNLKTTYYLNCQVRADLAVSAGATPTNPPTLTAEVSQTPNVGDATPTLTPTTTSNPPTQTPVVEGPPEPFPITETRSTAPDPDDLIIAVVSTFSGQQASRGFGIFQAMKIVAERSGWDDKLGALNRPVWLVPFDDQGKQAVGTDIANRIKRNEGGRYLIVVGHNRSDVLRAALPIYGRVSANETPIPVISVGATNADLTTDPTINVNNVLFRIVGRDDVQAKVAADFIRTKIAAERSLTQPPRVYIVYDPSVYGSGLYRMFLKNQAGLNIVGEQLYDANILASIVSTVRDEQPDVVYFPGYFNQTGPFLDALADAYEQDNLQLPAFVGSDGSDSREMINLAGNATEGMFYTAVAMPEAELRVRTQSNNSQLIVDYETRYQSLAPTFVGESADGIALALTAIASAGTDGDVSATETLTALGVYRDQRFAGETGNYRFNAQGDPTQSFYYIKRVPTGVTLESWPQNPYERVEEEPPAPAS
jgi:ABC-type branched-subunit amino acid transport system substrate-binding protein